VPEEIDITFDFRSDTPTGKDPDTFSPTLRRYHKLLWSKTLPGGALFELDDSRRRLYLHHRSELGEYFLSSDAVVPSFTREPRLSHIMSEVPVSERDAFNRLGYTIGGMMVFPGDSIDGKMTINCARGCHPRIKDRFDLTVECIRRYYQDETSPLSAVLGRYPTFFQLFRDFRGYVEFFMLQDMVSDDFSGVKFFSPFENFRPFPLPATLEAYMAYKRLAMGFIEARNRRILAEHSW